VAAANLLLSIVVPVFNEEATIGAVIERLREVPFPIRHEIVVVNDGSTDATRSLLDSLRPADDLRIVHADVNGGKGSAIRIGLRHVRGDIVAIQDADLELDPAQIGVLVQPLLDGRAGVVYGSRFLHRATRVPIKTLAANKLLTALTNLLFGATLTDMETCYKVMWTDVARSLELSANRFDIEPEITARLLRAGHRIVELPVRFEPRSRAAGKKIGWRDGLHAIATLVKQRLRA
jgi:glycosyltransferase involved in cell wall biosynthesis